MNKKLQVNLSDKAFQSLQDIVERANDGFEYGKIKYSDVINEIIVNTKVNIEDLRSRNTNIKIALRIMLKQKNMDIKAVSEKIETLKNKVQGGNRKRGAQ